MDKNCVTVRYAGVNITLEEGSVIDGENIFGDRRLVIDSFRKVTDPVTDKQEVLFICTDGSSFMTKDGSIKFEHLRVLGFRSPDKRVVADLTHVEPLDSRAGGEPKSAAMYMKEYVDMLADLRESYNKRVIDKLNFKEGDYIEIEMFDHERFMSRKRMKISWMHVTHLGESVDFQITGHRITPAGHMKKNPQSEFFHLSLNMPNGRVIEPITDYRIRLLTEEQALTRYIRK